MNKILLIFVLVFASTKINAQAPCSITASATNITCNDNGTPIDPSDDTFTFDVSTSGSNTGSGWSANDPNITTDLYTNSPTSFGPYDISAGDLTITITDYTDNTCTAIITVAAPGVCSNLCEAYILPHHDFLTVSAYGMPPFSYLWSNGSTTDTTDITGPEICVTVTAANNCISTDCIDLSSACNVFISKNNGLGVLETFSTSPTDDINFLWNTGATTSSITPLSVGTYTVTATNTVTTCSATDSIVLSCGDEISKINVQIDSFLSSTFLFTTNYGHFGATSVLWNTGETTTSITPTIGETYSVTTTDAIGCTSSTSFTFTGNCQTSISSSLTAPTLTANSIIGSAPFSYAWSTGETTESITPTSAGVYHVTITDANNCNSTASFSVSSTTMSIEGSVDPYNAAKRVYLISHDANNGTLTALDSIDIEPYNTFTFSNLDVGQYLVKATLLPIYTPTTHFPTYYDYTNYSNNYGTLFWSDAQSIRVYLGHPIGDAYFSLIEGNNPGGPGFIGGLISEGANFTHNGSSTEGEGDPIAHQIIHLLKQDGTPVTYTYTDENGAFSFNDLDYGNYKLVLDIINKTQAFNYITLSPDHASANISFIVNEENIVLSNFELINTESIFSISPNPTTDDISLSVRTLKKENALITITDITGKTVISKNRIITPKSSVHLDTSQLPEGTYFIRLQIKNKVFTQKMTKL